MNDPRSKNSSQSVPPSASEPTSGTDADARTPYKGQPDDLHDLFEVMGTDEDDPLAAMRDDPNYAALIRDLESIAVAARELFQTAGEAPSDKVWDKIQSQLPSKPNA